MTHPVMTQRQAAAYLLMGVDTFREQVRPHVRYKIVGQTMLFHVTELDRWLTS